MQERCNTTQAAQISETQINPTQVEESNGDNNTSDIHVAKTEDCYPCAFGISYIFSKYEKFLSTTIEAVFGEISAKATRAL